MSRERPGTALSIGEGPGGGLAANGNGVNACDHGSRGKTATTRNTHRWCCIGRTRPCCCFHLVGCQRARRGKGWQTASLGTVDEFQRFGADPCSFPRRKSRGVPSRNRRLGIIGKLRPGLVHDALRGRSGPTDQHAVPKTNPEFFPGWNTSVLHTGARLVRLEHFRGLSSWCARTKSLHGERDRVELDR